METIEYSFSDFEHDINVLINKLRTRSIDIIVGINRGGCIPSVCLSHALKIPSTMIDWSTRDGANVFPLDLVDYFKTLSEKYQKVLIVDDLIDSGSAIRHIVNASQSLVDVSVATLLHNKDVDIGVETFCGTEFSRLTETRYFDFWWETVTRNVNEQ